MNPGAWIAAAALLAAVLAGLAWQRGNGRMRETRGDGPDLAHLGVEPGQVTLLQFSSAFCTPCRATRALCSDVAGRLDGLTHIEVDAESNLDTVRELNILRTPTVLIVDRSGRIVRRASGQPTRAQLMAAVSALL
ncbi:TlpA family protein disulfide reductase [Longispora albida]|uniref:TlpA family protein disulfide reductase n=1 Tax=Longispora albida TaxID=203523 RepID=UPI00038274DC|nr:thioredoxin family protein [Longispora albida]